MVAHVESLTKNHAHPHACAHAANVSLYFSAAPEAYSADEVKILNPENVRADERP